MIDPKSFYKKMDSLLIEIGNEHSGSHYLLNIAKEVEKIFGSDLHLDTSRVYEKNTDEFILISPLQDFNETVFPLRISLKTQTIELIKIYRLYIFDSPDNYCHIKLIENNEYSIPAAFVVESRANEWIVVFELKSGWIREEIEFCLNLIRTLIDYKLFAASLQTELEQASKIQKSLLPACPPNIPGYRIAGFSQPAALVGGDFYDYYKFENKFGFYMGDASGHGIPAALMARDAVIGLRMVLRNKLKIIPSLKKLNSVIAKSIYSTGFISFFFAEINNEGNIIYVNAGHPPAILIDENGIKKLDPTGPVLGAIPKISIEKICSQLSPESLLIIYSDGILERQNKEGEFYGEERLNQLVYKIRNLDVNDILEKIFLSVDEFGGDLKWEDDATIIVIKKIN